jgi:hypothetical protein
VRANVMFCPRIEKGLRNPFNAGNKKDVEVEKPL